MTEESVAAEIDKSAASEEESVLATEEKRNGSGPGFMLGIVLGLIAGAAGATLFAPATGGELRHRVAEEAGPLLRHEEGAAEGATPAPGDRIRSALERVRARVQEASHEAREAATEAEEQTRSRYQELTQDE